MKTVTAREHMGYKRYKPGGVAKLLLLIIFFVLFALFLFFFNRINYLFTDDWTYITVGGLEKIEEQKGFFGDKSVIYTQNGNRITVDGTYQDFHKHLNETGIPVVLKRPASSKDDFGDGNNLWCVSDECHFQSENSETFFRLIKD